jgi:hypothetical protein
LFDNPNFCFLEYQQFKNNLKFQHKPKWSSFKNPHIIKNRPIIIIIIITEGRPKSLKLLYSIMNLNTIYPCLRSKQGKANRLKDFFIKFVYKNVFVGRESPKGIKKLSLQQTPTNVVNFKSQGFWLGQSGTLFCFFTHQFGDYF